MVAPEQLPAKRRPQIIDGLKEPAEIPNEDSWIKDFIGRLAVAIRKIGDNK